MLKNRFKANLSYIFMFFLIVLQVFMISRYSIDIPYFDEWELFRPDSFLIDPSVKNLVAQHNEHRSVLPNLVFSLYYHALDLHFPTTFLLNFAVFTLLFLLFLKFSYNLKNKPFIALSSLMAFSALNYDNHLWTFQIQWHFFLLFLILSCYLLSISHTSYRNIIWFIVLPFCMLYSLCSGNDSA